ncbi:hypothetical protein FDECE_9685 [Fusarium decemcellulare]|nr:hypothetical protein FDECE_9685 [Fusarium decemcellulare]
MPRKLLADGPDKLVIYTSRHPQKDWECWSGDDQSDHPCEPIAALKTHRNITLSGTRARQVARAGLVLNHTPSPQPRHLPLANDQGHLPSSRSRSQFHSSKIRRDIPRTRLVAPRNRRYRLDLRRSALFHLARSPRIASCLCGARAAASARRAILPPSLFTAPNVQTRPPVFVFIHTTLALPLPPPPTFLPLQT